ncbi:MAG TPA: hypothetical protein VJ931_17425 [Actinomycetota bacterium]|nr:hypothetical protein [Actinomycetota bacterium]
MTDPAPDVALALNKLAGRLTELGSLVRGLSINNVLFSGTVVIGADGYTTLDNFTVDMASVAILSGATAAGGAVAVNAPPANTPPTSGVGVLPVRPGMFVCAPLVGNVLTIYGEAGDVVWVGVSSRPWPPVAAYAPVAVTAEAIPAVSGLISSVAPCRYQGFTIAETAGAPAQVRIRDGSATGTILENITLNATESADDFYEIGVAAPSGIYVELVAGAVAGSIRHSGA